VGDEGGVLGRGSAAVAVKVAVVDTRATYRKADDTMLRNSDLK